MGSETDFPTSGSTKKRSRFTTVRVEKDEEGNSRIVLTGDQLLATGFEIGEEIDAIFQEGLISILRLD
ncbi:MAG: hypothetical protein R3270_02535 [Gammaproteobacteria bacterium]|nr:hypothetical protein [Gammaproteobacteria bacterium]